MKNYIVYFLIFFVHQIQVSITSKCLPIEECSPTLAALDDNSINRTIEIRCVFREKTDIGDILWKFKLNKDERMIKDLEGQILQPFRHDLITLNNSYTLKPYSVSVLKIALLNSSYYTNYTIMSLSGSCSQTVRIIYKEKALANIMANSGISTKSQNLINTISTILIIKFITSISFNLIKIN